MGNHFHLVVETPNANLVDGMHWLLSAYTIRLNRRHETTGHVFSGRYKALLVEGGGGYLKTVCDDVHLNPVRANLLKAEEKLAAYPWSSLMWYFAAKEHRPGWIRVYRLLGEHRIQEDAAAGRQEFERRMEARRMQAEDDEQLKPIRRGWCLGSPEFRARMLEQLDQGGGDKLTAEIRRESAVSKAERIVAEELTRLGWKEEDLERRRKNDPGKLAIAARLRKETVLTIRSISAFLHLGSYNTAATNLRTWMHEAKTTPKEND